MSVLIETKQEEVIFETRNDWRFFLQNQKGSDFPGKELQIKCRKIKNNQQSSSSMMNLLELGDCINNQFVQFYWTLFGV